MLRNEWLVHPEGVHDFVDTSWRFRERLDDPHPEGMCQGSKEFSRCQPRFGFASDILNHI